MLQNAYKRNVKESRISVSVSKRAALVALSGFIVLKIIKSIHLYQKFRKFNFTWIAIHITDNSIININIKAKTKMKVWSKVYLIRNPHHAEANQLIFIEWQMTGLHLTQDLTDRSHQRDLRISRTLKIVKNTLKLLKSMWKILFR